MYTCISKCLRQTAAHPCGRTHRFRSKILEKVSPRRPQSTTLGPKIHQVGLQNPPSWGPKSRKISLGRSLESSWGHLGRKRHTRSTKTPTRDRLRPQRDRLRPPQDRLRPPFWGPKSILKAFKRSSFWWSFFNLSFEAIWTQLGPILAPKTTPKWRQVSTKI